MQKNGFDLHLHTDISSDSTESMQAYADAALKLGLRGICFTDHFDNDPEDEGFGSYDMDGYFSKLDQIKQKYEGRLLILAGVEFSEPNRFPGQLELVRRKPYDYVIGSLHIWLNGLFPGQMVKEGISSQACYDDYWNEMLNMVRFGGFDCVGHLDFPKRYYEELTYEEPMLREIFRAMVKNEICLEINTSSLSKGLAEPMPSSTLLALYKQEGGKYFTMGSDAHDAARLYDQIDAQRAMALALGLREVYFRQRQMILV